jgi:small multidrug resistance family-3 protein
MLNIAVFLGAAFAEIAGCFSFWACLRLDKSRYWLIPGILALSLFSYLLTLAESDYAGRAYAAYGAIYICASLVWMWIIENNPPSKIDIIGAAICVVGACIILFAQKIW